LGVRVKGKGGSKGGRQSIEAADNDARFEWARRRPKKKKNVTVVNIQRWGIGVTSRAQNLSPKEAARKGGGSRHHEPPHSERGASISPGVKNARSN